MAETYKPAPFNYCDYRCDRCEYTETCRVYKEDQERLLGHYVKGEDPHDPEVFLNDIQSIFAKTKQMISEMAEKQGIDISTAPDQDVPEVKPEEYVIYRLAREYYKEANAFIKELERAGISDTTNDAYSDLVWYHTLIAAKTGRLVSGFIDDFLEEDLRKIEENGTLQVIQKGIDLSRNALEIMLNELPDHLHTIANLMDLLKKIERQISVDIRQKVG